MSVNTFGNINRGCHNDHRLLMAVSFFYILLQCCMPALSPFVSIAPIILFIYYSWRRVATILITALVVAGLVMLIPPLAPVAFIIMVIIFIFRLSYIIDNWRAVAAGFYMYGVAAFYGYSENSFYLYYGLFNNILFYYGFGFVQAAAVTFIFHRIMMWLYRNGYTTKTAMPIMGIAPLLIILLLMPFIKAFDGFDAGADTSADTAEASFDSADTASDTAVTSDSPGYHHTNDYYRTAADGSVQHVRGYIATNPDGIVENNLSYKGISMADNSIGAGETTVVAHPVNNQHSLEFEGADAGRSPRGREADKND